MAIDCCDQQDCKWLDQGGNCARGKASAARKAARKSAACPECFEKK